MEQETSAPRRRAGVLGCLGRALLWGVVGIVALILLAMLARYLLAQQHVRQAGKDATAGYVATRQAFDQDVTDLERLVTRDLGTAPAVTGRAYSCGIDHADSGWFVSSYDQHCDWHVVQYYPVDARSAVARFGLQGDTGDRSTTLFLPLREEDQRFRYLTTWVMPAADPESDLTAFPATSSQTGGSEVITQPVPDGAVDAGRDWVVVRYDRAMSRTELGCTPELIFCGQPTDTPQMPRP